MMLGPSTWTRSWVRATRGAASLRVTRGLSGADVSVVDEARWEYDHDVLVVGGGIVGSCLACRLAQDSAAASTGTGSSPGGRNGSSGKRGPSVGLIEARPPPSLEDAMAREGPDPRVYALTPSSVRLLKAVGVWDGAGVGGREAVLKGRSQPYGGMQVWDNRGPGHLRFDSEGKGAGGSPLGFISEHGVIHSALFDRVRELEAAGQAEVMCPAQVKRVSFPPVGVGGATGPVKVTVETASGETSDVSCRLLVAADGGDSKVAKMLGLPSFGWGYGQRAVVATVRLSAPHGETAFQRYLSTGPLAMLPLKGGMMASLVWSTTPEHAERLKSMSPAGFLQEVNNALSLPPAIGTPPASASGERSVELSGERSGEFPPSPFSAALAAGARMRAEGGFPVGIVEGVPSSLAALPFAAASALGEGIARGAEGVAGALAGLSLGLEGAGAAGFCVPPEAVEVMTPRLGFDLSLRQAHRYTGERAALVGDAAHTIHPMAGQGLNLGIADADALARAVLEGRRSGTDVGSKTLLGRYEEERKTEALVMMGALDGLHRLFGADGRAVAAARSAGLSALNTAGPLKRRLARHAMGGGT